MKHNLTKRVKNIKNLRVYKTNKNILERNMINQSTEMPRIRDPRQKNYSTIGINYKSLQENANNSQVLQSISRNIEYRNDTNNETSISVNRASPERAPVSRTSRTGMVITHRSKSISEKIEEKKMKASYLNDPEKIDTGPLYKLKLLRQSKNPSRSLVEAQKQAMQDQGKNLIDERAAEELIEHCNEILIAQLKLKEDNFKDRSVSKTHHSLIQEDNIIPFSSIHNLDGKKVLKVSEIEGNLVLLVNKYEGKLLQLLVNYISAAIEEKYREANKNIDDYKYVIRTAGDKWYDKNLYDWKLNSQQILSNDNIYKCMNMYKTNHK